VVELNDSKIRRKERGPGMLNAIEVPKELQPVLLDMQKLVKEYFGKRQEDYSKGTIELHGDRLILLRAASVSVDFFETIKDLYKDYEEREALTVARSFLFDISHAIAKMDARNFHQKNGIVDPMEKLAAGPIYFAHSGFAFVQILPESHITADENYFSVYDHLRSFEADAWLRRGKRTDCPVCVMNAGYSSGWCEESLGIPLVATEIMCKAKGDDTCRFIMAPPSRIQKCIEQYCSTHSVSQPQAMMYRVPSFFDERKRMETALRQREEQFRTLVCNIPGAVYRCACNDERTMEFISDVIEDISGYPASDFIDNSVRTYASIIHPEDRQIVQGIIEGQAKQRTHYAVEYRIVGAKGKVTWVWEKGQAILAENGEVRWLDGVLLDVMERKWAEQIQMQLSAELKRSNRELKDFAYMVSHDLKAPLRGINTLTRWLQSDFGDKLDERGREQMELLLGQVSRMNSLIDGILQYSRVGRILEDKVEVSLNELVPEVIGMVAPPENIAIDVEDELPVIECERTRMIQVFQNLIGNAVKYMDKSHGWIRISCAEEHGRWKFSIADNGTGIEEKHAEKIFQLFQTFSRDGQAKGTGIGLSVAKKIIELYGGQIWVESQVGQGSTFVFTLPKMNAVAERNESTISASH
jgi:PAS domain S-box-containing protein